MYKILGEIINKVIQGKEGWETCRRGIPLSRFLIIF